MYDPFPMTRSRTPRLWRWMIATVCLIVLVWLIAPHQIPVMAYKTANLLLAVVLAYWVDCALFPYARPHSFAHTDPVADRQAHWARSMAMMRRAVIVLACVLGVTLGL